MMIGIALIVILALLRATEFGPALAVTSGENNSDAPEEARQVGEIGSSSQGPVEGGDGADASGIDRERFEQIIYQGKFMSNLLSFKTKKCNDRSLIELEMTALLFDEVEESQRPVVWQMRNEIRDLFVARCIDQIRDSLSWLYYSYTSRNSLHEWLEIVEKEANRVNLGEAIPSLRSSMFDGSGSSSSKSDTTKPPNQTTTSEVPHWSFAAIADKMNPRVNPVLNTSLAKSCINEKCKICQELKLDALANGTGLCQNLLGVKELESHQNTITYIIRVYSDLSIVHNQLTFNQVHESVHVNPFAHYLLYIVCKSLRDNPAPLEPTEENLPQKRLRIN